MLFLVLSLCFSAFYYIEAFRSGMSQRRWALVGLIFGPLALPLFSIKRYSALRRAIGFNASYLSA